jgi:hypothetical protein
LHTWNKTEFFFLWGGNSPVQPLLSLPEGSDMEDIWERVIVPSIQMKYVNIKGNINMT